jgi:acetyl-CoA C-acetyltransferase
MTTGPSIIGWAHTPFGRSPAPDVTALLTEVISPALSSAQIDASDVDAVFVSVYNNGFSAQGFEAALVSVAEPQLATTPATRLENACASGSAAMFAACDFIESGRGRVALVLGAEKMTAIPSAQAGDVLLSGSLREETRDMRGGFAGVFAGIAQAYHDRYVDPSDAMALIAAKNHANAVTNPYAHMRKDLGVDFCSSPSDANPLVAPPLRRTDCAPISDGAAAAVVASPDVARSAARRVRFLGRAQAADALQLSGRDPLAFDGARRAWDGALAQAGLEPWDLSLIETHDCFTIAELLQYEAFGLAEPGRGAALLEAQVTSSTGRLPVNRSGGLKARGHPIGATGVSMHVMAAMQVTGTAGDMQLPRADVAGVFNMGGAAVANYASVLEGW